MPDSEFCVILVTTNTKESSNELVSMLLQSQLAACIQTIPVDSHYYWNGQICADQESLLLIKTRSALFQQIQDEIIKIHPYDTPQIVQLPVTAGLPDYLQWLNASVVPVRKK
ncbi:divalent-cation tolerance protein CutA [Vibrio quintilis]|uniref:Divalent-cation tolerance protein CutA n=1 Tax=Vibrio quintilis TaxID=1117707 RepID=A0A1M7Z1F3_9VIBR|nr:divalent-cation tolerance protein CutA [Vibrio quintilis]SHO58610.1 Divalent-cation tolerance protein CutA [Vibrio quintilis]